MLVRQIENVTIVTITDNQARTQDPPPPPSHPTQNTITPWISATSFFDFDKNKYLFENMFLFPNKIKT